MVQCHVSPFYRWGTNVTKLAVLSLRSLKELVEKLQNLLPLPFLFFPPEKRLWAKAKLTSTATEFWRRYNLQSDFT